MTDEQFTLALTECRTAFRLEYQRDPLDAEQDAYRQWLNGNPLKPWEWRMWRDWLDFTWRLAKEGTRIFRVRLVDDPPTPYQAWGRWATPWHEEAGDHIRYLPCTVAERLGIPMANWWIIDDTLITMDGIRKTLITDPEIISTHMAWRDLAVHAVPA